MKKQLCFLLTVCLLLSLAACRKPVTQQPQTSETVNPSTNGSTPTTGTTPTGPTNATTPTGPVDNDQSMVAVSVPVTTEQQKANDGTLLFEYSYQNLSLVLHKPTVADKIIIDFLNRIDSTRTAAENIKESAKTAYNNQTNWVAYRYSITYNPTRIDHRVLSLSGTKDSYSGGPHPNRTCISANYDLETGDYLTLASIMTKDATVDNFCQLVLEGLAELAEGDYLYEDYALGVKHRFTADPTQDQDWYFTDTGLCFTFEPYEIAPYSAGIVTVEIPYQKLQGLLFEDYFPSQRPAATGNLRIAAFSEVDLKQFSHIAELIQNKNGKMYMICPEGDVQDIQITCNGVTIFAAYKLGAGEGIMLQANEDALASMQLIYVSSGQRITKNLQ